MPDLGFQREFREPLLEGSKVFTLRRAWKNGRTPDIGARLRLITGARTPERRVFATAVVAFRCTATLGAIGVLNYSAWRQLDAADTTAYRVRHMLDQMSCGNLDWPDEFARADGFPGYFHFWRFHNAHRAAGSGAPVRELIGLGMVTEAFADG